MIKGVESYGTRWTLAIGLLLLIWGSKLMVIGRYASDVPQTDQWYAEGARLLLPYQQGRLDAAVFVQPHNEHRIVCTRVLALALVALNGQWDAQLQCVVNAALHAALVVAVFFWGRTMLDRRWRVIWLALLIVLTAPPVAWENVVSGFHSQQYFLVGFSLATIAIWGTAPPGTAPWWAGLGCAVLALGTMASGFFAALTIGVVLAASIRTREDWRRHRATIAASALIVVIGAFALAQATPAEDLHARSPGDYAAALARYLQWQYERLFWFRNEPMLVLLAPLQWLPWFWLAWRFWRRGAEAGPKERVVFAVGLWTLLQIAASAYARGAGAPWVSSRYVDTLVVGFSVNALALGMLWNGTREYTLRHRRALVGAAMLGFICTMGGLSVQVAHFFRHELPAYHELVTHRTERMRDYLETGDRTIFDRGDVLFYVPIDLAELLDQPEIRRLLPASLQPHAHPVGPLSICARHAVRLAPGVALLGVTLLVVAMARGRWGASSMRRCIVD